MAPLDGRACRKALVVVAASASLLAAARLPLHRAGPPPAHTGGFGEATCHECHFDYPLNEEPRARITLDSLPDRFVPGATYRLRLRVRHAQLKRGGFQLSARFDDGKQAGSFVGDSAHVRVQRAHGIEYGSHTAVSSDRASGDVISWEIVWRAPAEARAIVFHVASNVANDDASEFGDRIFTETFDVLPASATR